MNTPDFIVLFDGHCHLCDRSVKMILKYDFQQKFSFASLQSQTGKMLIVKHKINVHQGESIILIKKEKFFIKSDAALWIASELKYPVNLIAGLIIFPPFIRNYVYDIVAKYRYKWFGKSDSCLIPDSNQRHRFIDL